MELSIFVAKILALIYLAVGLGSFSGQISFKKVMSSFENSEGLTLIVGYFAVLVGMLLVEYHNIWVKDWTVLVTIVGWAALIKGVMYIAFPRQMFTMAKGMVKNEQSWSVLIFAIGLLFGYFGFIA